MSKKICISGYYGFDNFGDETILNVLVSNIKKHLDSPDITVFSANPSQTAKKLDVKSIYSFDIKQVINCIKDSDCLISGGGSLLQDVTSKKSLIYYLFIIIIALFSKKKVIIFAQGIGPIENKVLSEITAFLIKRAKYVSVRDERSLNFLKKHGINATLCSDPVWNIESNGNFVKKDRVGIQLRDHKLVNDEFLKNLAKAVIENYSEKEIYILSLQNKFDLSVCNKLKEEITAINNISSCSEIIAMRYHACLVALKAGVKVLPVNYDIKVEGFAKEFNLNCIDLKDISGISNTIKSFKNTQINIRKELIEAKQFDFQTFVEKF